MLNNQRLKAFYKKRCFYVNVGASISFCLEKCEMSFMNVNIHKS